MYETTTASRKIPNKCLQLLDLECWPVFPAPNLCVARGQVAGAFPLCALINQRSHEQQENKTIAGRHTYSGTRQLAGGGLPTPVSGSPRAVSGCCVITLQGQ